MIRHASVHVDFSPDPACFCACGHVHINSESRAVKAYIVQGVDSRVV